jgi:hypothetical protein
MSEQKESRLLRLVEELTDAAERVGLEVRRERIMREVGYRVRGGACRLREKDMVIIDREQPTAEQLEILVDALKSHDLESLYLSPAARRIMQSASDQVQEPSDAAIR